MSNVDITVLFQSADVVVVDKPAGIPTEPGRDGGASLRDRTEAALGKRPGGRAPHAVSRLDTNVTGAVVFALTERGAKALAEARQAGTYLRVYLALAFGALEERGVWRKPIDGAPAETLYRSVDRAGPDARPTSLLGLTPRTGRTHQIRIHASSGGAPLVGDRRYGGPSTVPARSGRMLPAGRPMLHAAAVVIPTGDAEGTLVRSPIAEDMRALWSALDGRPEAWEEALVVCGAASSSPPP